MNPATPSPICHRCRKPLVGEYVQALDADWHPDCWRCEACGKPLQGAFVPEAGLPYHPACHAEAFGMRCSLCHGLISGKFFEHEGKPVCEKDFLARFAPRCFLCDAVLRGTFKVNASGQRACARHDHGPCCPSCGRWLGRKEKFLAPLAAFGSALCGQCQGRAIGQEEVRKYGNGFGAQALRETGLVLQAMPAVPLRLATAAQVSRLKGARDEQVDGVTRTSVETVNGRESSRSVQEIVVVGGLVQEHFEGILAHEFGHVWLFNERYDQVRGLLAEGFCEMVKFRWLESLESPLAQDLQARMLENPDPVYGDGFRLMKARWDQRGTAGLIDLLRVPALG